MKTFVMLTALSVICLVLIMDSSPTPTEDQSEERSSEECRGHSGESAKDPSDEAKITNEKKLFRDLPQTAASFLSSSFMYKCRK